MRSKALVMYSTSHPVSSASMNGMMNDGSNLTIDPAALNNASGKLKPPNPLHHLLPFVSACP